MTLPWRSVGLLLTLLEMSFSRITGRRTQRALFHGLSNLVQLVERRLETGCQFVG